MPKPGDAHRESPGAQPALTPERLLGEFGPRSAIAARVVRLLADLVGPIEAGALNRVAAHDRVAFSRAHAVDDSASLLRAIHTYYALIIKLVAVGVTTPEHRWAADPQTLRNQLVALESGELLRGTGLRNLIQRDEYAWYIDHWTDELAASLRDLLIRWTTLDFRATTGDLFKAMYHAWIPGAVRHALGEFYTPDWLAEHTLDLAGYTGDPRTRCLDASCGSGTFLVLALRRARAFLERHPVEDPLDALLNGVVGFDLNPLAVLAARVNYVLALGPLLRQAPARERELPVHLVDTVLLDHARDRHAFDIVVGNPPHISWRHLPAAWRRQATALFAHHGLFTLTGLAAQHGGSQKDIAALFIYVVLDQLLKVGGTLALVVHTSLLKTDGAGEGFRRFRLGDGVAFRVEEAHDFSSFQPFHTASDRQIKTRTLSLRIRKGEPTSYPVPYHVWTKARRGHVPEDSSWPAARAALQREELAARPLRGPLSPWMCTRRDQLLKMQRLLAPSDHVPAYHAHVGAYTGGLNGCYWLEVLERNADGTLLVENCADIGKKPVRRVRATIEPDLVHPLLRGRQTARWTSTPAGHILMVQDPQRKSGYRESWLAERYPRTHQFLAQFRAELLARPVYQKFFAASAAPFYSMYGVRPETFAAHKVVWMEISATMKASLLGLADDGKVVVPDHKVILVAVASEQEGDYLAGVLNSEDVGATLRAYAVDNNVATNILKNVVIPAFAPMNPTHATISAAARAVRLATLARDAAAVSRAEAELAAVTPPLWG